MKKEKEPERDFAKEREEARAREEAKTDLEYNQLRTRLLSMKPEERVKDKVVIEYIKTAIIATGNTPTKEMVIDILPSVIKFYRENPYNIYPNPLCFKHLLPHMGINKFNLGGMRLIENCLAKDYRCAVKEDRKKTTN